MAFIKTADAKVFTPDISIPAWEGVRHQAGQTGFDQRLAATAVLGEFDPNKYLLSHCTIIASVDTEQVNAPLGRQMLEGFQIDRQYNDYYVKASTSQFINNNQDCWERKLLLSAFRTFMGAENYVEHLQIPELSKGKIIDAAARDIGESVYVDILVATDRKHQPLINAITAGQLKTLSMGCQVKFTVCTKCGNVAEDETQLCHHIKYQKGHKFIDGQGIERKIAELCGHVTSEPGSVKFIEASWVANPAFTGAVLRSILTPQEAKLLGPRLQVAFSQPTRTADPGAMAKAAYAKNSFEDFEGEKDQSGEEEAPAEDEGEEDPLKGAIDELAQHIRDKAVEKVRGDMSPSHSGMSEDENDTLIKSAIKGSTAWTRIAKVVLAEVKNPPLARRILAGLIRHKRGGWGAVQAGQKLSGREILAVSRFLDLVNRGNLMAGENRIYRTVLNVGGAAAYGDVNGFLTACRRVIGRELTASESEALLIKGRLYDLGS